MEIQAAVVGIGNIGTADYLVGVLSNALPAFIVPTLIFILGALISFATGTSYGTMSIEFA